MPDIHPNFPVLDACVLQFSPSEHHPQRKIEIEKKIPSLILRFELFSV